MDTNPMENPTDIGDRVGADLAAAPDDDEARLRILDELYNRLESELDRDLGATGTPRH